MEEEFTEKEFVKAMKLKKKLNSYRGLKLKEIIKLERIRKLISRMKDY